MRAACVAAATIGILASVLPGVSLAHSGKIPIGNGKVSSSARVGYVFSCQQRFNPNAGGAFATGDWIKNGYWYPDLKPTVDGAVKWSGGGTKITVSGNTRKITSKGLPTHTTGTYPIARTDDAYAYDRNPNRISSQRISLTLPANPTKAARPTCVSMGMIGVAITGAAIYNALDAMGRDAAAYEILGNCDGHPQRSGEYHYHGPSDCMTEVGKGSDGHSGLVGYALDGFGIYGLNGAGGRHMTNARLDACHGHTETVVWDGKSVSMYHYHLTDEYPYTLGCFVGTANVSGQSNIQYNSLFPSNQSAPDTQGPPQGGGQDVLSIAAADLGVSVDALRQAVGAPPPNFRRAARMLGISEARIRRAMNRARRQAQN